VRDNRYYAGIKFDEFVKSLEILNKKKVNYLISYDGECGGKEYGEDLPESLRCKKILLNAGLSSQSLLLGKKATTFESLYISESLVPFSYAALKRGSICEALA
jgi:DNA adenine methylase